MKILQQIETNWKLWLIASLTLGLAPFNPPHIVGKLEWIAGGAVGMGSKDWFDVFLHGTPWILLIFAAILILKRRFAK